MSYYDVIFTKEPDHTTDDDGNKTYPGLYACVEVAHRNKAGKLIWTIWHALVTQEQHDKLQKEPVAKRPLNPNKCDPKYFRSGAAKNNWKCYHAFGPGRDTMIDETEAKELEAVADPVAVLTPQ